MAWETKFLSRYALTLYTPVIRRTNQIPECYNDKSSHSCLQSRNAITKLTISIRRVKGPLLMSDLDRLQATFLFNECLLLQIVRDSLGIALPVLEVFLVIV